MLIYDHLVGNTYLGELQKFRMHNVSTLTDGGTSNTGLLQYKTSTNALYVYLGGGSGDAFWRRLAMSGDTAVASGFTLGTNKIWVGDGSNVPQEVLKSSIPRSDFGTPTADISMGGYKITNLADPVSNGDAVTLSYVNNLVQGLIAKGSCLIASNAALPACTYSNGSLSLTASANGAMTATTIDSGASSSTLIVGSRVLIKNQAVSEQNGIYVVQSLGSAGTPWVLVRALDANTNAELKAAFTIVEQGTYADKGYTQTSDDYDITAVSTKNITWVLFSSAGSYVAGTGTGLIVTGGNVFNFAKSTAYAAGDMFYGITGGTGEAATTKIDILPIGAVGKMMQSTGTAPSWTPYTMPTAAPAANSLIKSDGTNLVAHATANNSLLMTNGTGVISWGTSLPSGVTYNGNTMYYATGSDVTLADGGTSASLTAVQGGLVYSTNTALAITAAGTSGYFVRSGGTGAPTFFDLFGTANTWSVIQTHSTASAGVSLIGFKQSAASFNALEITSSGKILMGVGTATPAIYLSGGGDGTTMNVGAGDLALNSLSAAQPALLMYNIASTGGVRLQYSGGAIATKTWNLPANDGVNYVWKSDGSGNLTSAQITASMIGSGAALTKTDDTNVTLTLGGSPSTALLVASSLTLGWTGTLAVSRGGTGQGSNLTQYGIVYASSATAMASTVAPTLIGQVLRGNTGGAHTWSGYTMPATLAGANSLLLSSSATVLGELTPTANRLLSTDGSSVVTWGGILNVARNTAGGIARKWCNQVVGDGVNAYISVTHNLNSRDVIVSARNSVSGDTGSQEIGYTKITVEDANTIRVYFNAVQTASNYYVVTVVG